MTLGPIHLAEPIWLVLLLPFGAILWIVGRKSLSGLGPKATILAHLVRLIVALCAVAALCDPSIQDESERLALVVIADESASMPRSARDELRTLLSQTLNSAQREDTVAIVSAAKQARVQGLPLPVDAVRDDDPLAPLMNDLGPREGTNLATALSFAPVLVRGKSGARVLLVSDGNQTEGDMISAARSLSALGVPVDVMVPTESGGAEVLVEDLAVPQNARRGATVDLRVVIRATEATSGRLSVVRNGRMVDLTPGEQGTSLPVDIPEGEQVLSVPITLTGSGPQQFEAVLETESGDNSPANNRAQAVTFVEGEGAVLFITADPVGAQPLIDALREAEIEIQTILPAAVSWDPIELSQYDAALLFDVGAYEFDLRQQETLAEFVHAGGGGLIVVGGPDSFGAGGWIGTPIEEVLPLRLDPPSERQLPRGALAIVLDASGSMASPVGSSGFSQQQVANKAAWFAAQSLTPLDEIAVISFDTQTYTNVPLQMAQNREQIREGIDSIGPGGGTYIMGGLRAAIDTLDNAKGSVKHIILLSDGRGTGSNTEALQLIDMMTERQITLSTVAVGDGADVSLLNNLAAATGGRGYAVSSSQQLLQLPQLFIKEARIVQRPLIWEGDPVSAGVTAYTSTMQGMPGVLPPVTGYVITADREGLSTVTARFPNEHQDPLAAQWQHGLGRVVAFTSDAAARWNASWLGWQPYRTFWEQHVRWAMRPSGSPNILVSTHREGDRARVVVDAMRDDGSPLDLAQFQGRLISPGGGSSPLALRQVGPGRYEATYQTSDRGAYLATLAYDSGEDQAGNRESGLIRTAYVRAYPDELRWTQPNRRALERVAAATGGRVINPGNPPQNLFSRAGVSMPVSRESIWLLVVALAAGFFLMDIAVRRIRVDVLGAARALLGRRTADQSSGERLAGLREARARAAHRAQPAAKPVAVPQSARVAPPRPTASPTAATQSAPQSRSTKSKDDQSPRQSEDEPETGMSRLLSAKRRAQESIAGEDQQPE